MLWYPIILRLVHIFSGVFWVGTVFFYALFLLPRVRAAGPPGGQFMLRLTQPPLPNVMILAGGLSALSGLLLYWRDSGGFQWTWMQTGPGIAFGVAGLAGILAFLEGFFVSRPAATRAAAIGRVVMAAGTPPAPDQAAEIQLLSAKLGKAVYRTAYLMVITLIGMAVARYL